MSNNSKKYSFHSEAFVYLWFDSKNRMFYLGYHKGHPDDYYTHSSTVMESFTKTTISPYMRRRILATGTEQEMIDLEKKLLDNRKEKCWDKYYNVTVAFPPPPKFGEDHPNWKGGVSIYPEKIREYRAKNAERTRVNDRKYYEENREHYREQHRKYYQENREKVRERQNKNRANNPEKAREYDRKYYEENAEKIRESKRKWREKNREYHRKYYEENAEKVRKYQREYRAKNADKIREYYREYQREYRAKKKAEKAAGKVHFGD